ncbi:kinesin-like protein KIN-4C [Mercurialis annua]|uniref:kinesin-like protein KIN-4C n=1 Tax=Mercurialis annua TaxID=3986 RepID=UPI00215FF645|nr:kinesin-like protein KIN-4C [Mercurialis annua]
MKKPNNRRSNRSSIADSSPKSAIHEDEQQQPHCDNRADVLEKENEALKREIEDMKNKLATVSPNSIEKHKEDDDDSINSQKFIALEEQVTQLRKKLSVFSQLSAQKQISSSQKKKNGGGGEATLNEIQRLKAHKVQLLCKMKLESVQSRLSRASLEKQVLQLKKDHRRKDYELRKLLALNEKQKLVLQRKTEEASMATKRLKDLLESRKASSHRTSGQDAKSSQNPGVQGIELELKIDARVEDIRADYERQMEEMADEVLKYEEEAEMLREENFRCQLQQKEADCMVRESELRELKEEVFKLSNVVNQLGIPKAKVHMKRLDVDPVKPCVSSGSSSYYSFQSEDSGGNNVVLGKSTERVCCSCSKRSLCKTSKCECLAAFGSCGTGCGCTASKCKNRKDDSLQQEVAIDTAQSLGNTETEKGIAVPQASDMDNDNLPRRKPLSEIGNAVVNPSPKKPGKKTRGRKQVSQLDMAESSSLIPETAERTNMAVTVKPTRLTRAKRSAV